MQFNSSMTAFQSLDLNGLIFADKVGLVYRVNSRISKKGDLDLPLFKKGRSLVKKGRSKNLTRARESCALVPKNQLFQ